MAMEPTADGRAPPSRLFIVEFDLAELSSHFFNQVLGFKLAAEQLGLMPYVLLPKDVDPSLAEQLNAQCVIELHSTPNPSREYELDIFAESDRQLRSLWRAMEAMGPSRHDIVMITGARAEVIYSLGAWLSWLDRESRPATFIRFYDHDYLDLETMGYSDRSSLYRFAAMDLSLRQGQERVFFTANNQKLVTPLGRLCSRRVFHMPLPKYYGEISERAGARADTPVIYVHMNLRSGVMLGRIESVIRTVLEGRPDAKVLLKYCRNALQPGAEAGLSPDLAERGVELIATELSHRDHLRTIARSDIILLPYEASQYAALASGVFAEGAAFGKVVVYPDSTWMADQVSDGHAVGIGFSATSEPEISAAVLRALDALPGLLERAQERSSAFRDRHSCARNLDLMLRLAGENNDMRLTYAPGNAIRFQHRADSRGYMGHGWSWHETTGVWTEGPVAELLFLIEPKSDGPLEVRILLTPFVAGGHSQRIAISVNGVELCEWNFRGHEEPIAVWRKLTIPALLARSDELAMLVHVTSPMSPKQVGISDDTRSLGVKFHEMLILSSREASAS
jgi:hypothetical protein